MRARPPKSAVVTRSMPVAPSSSSAPRTGETAPPAAKRAKRPSAPPPPPLEAPSQPYSAARKQPDGSWLIQAPGLSLTYFPRHRGVVRIDNASGGPQFISPNVGAEEWRTVTSATDAQSLKAATDAIIANAAKNARLQTV